MNRRGMLRFLAAAPVAAPVVAREAAKLADVTAIGETGYLGMPESGGSLAIGGDIPYKSHIAECLRRIYSGKERDDIARQTIRVRRLDPDLASSRSLSLSAALRIQREREIDIELERRRRDWLEAFKRETGTEWIPESVTSIFDRKDKA